MAKTYHGNQLTSLMEICDGTSFTRDANGNDEFKIRHVCRWGSYQSLLPEIGSPATAAGYDSLFLAGVDVQRDEAGQAEVTLIYRGSTLTFDGLPLPSYQLLGAGQEVPINQHPAFKSTLRSLGAWSDSDGKFSDTGTLNGIESFMAPGASFVKTWYRRTAPAEGDLFRLGYLDNPDGLLGVTPGRWILTGHTAVTQGSFYQFQKTWQYSPTGWRIDLEGYHAVS